MSRDASKFCNVILCEDIRDEIGNKKSLMGVIGGDIVVPAFPAVLQIAVYIEYRPGPSDEDRNVNLVIRILEDDDEVGKANMSANIQSESATFVLPRGLLALEKPRTFRLLVSINGGPDEEILSKKIISAS